MLGDLYKQQLKNEEAKPYYQEGQRLLHEINNATPGIHVVVTNLDVVNERLTKM
jgi:hypothetical protein